MALIPLGPFLEEHRLRVVGLALVSLALSGGCQGTNEPIVIGVAAPFSTARAESMRLGAELAASEINQQGGIRSRTLELLFRDDSADADAAVRVANDFYEDLRVAAVIGHLNSGATIAAAPVYNGGDQPLVSVSPSASSPEISNAGPYTFRICPDDLVHGAQLAGWVREQLGVRSAAIFYENGPYGRGVRATFRQEFTKRGGRIESEDPYSDALPSFEPYLTRLFARGGAEALFIAGTRQGAERMLRTLDSMGSRPVIVGGDAISGIEASDVDVEGIVISSAYLPDRPGAQNEAFVAAYRRAYGDRPLDHRGAGAYDIVHLLARAMDEVGTDRRAIRDYLAGVGSRTAPYNGVTGRIAFNTNGDVMGKSVVIGVVRNKRLVTAPQQ